MGSHQMLQLLGIRNIGEEMRYNNHMKMPVTGGYSDMQTRTAFKCIWK